MTRQVELDAKIKLPVSVVWKLLTDINVYPQYVKYLKKAEIEGPVRIGTEWHDKTTVMWVPMWVKHVIVRLEENKELAFEVPLLFGGGMWQSFTLKENSGYTQVKARIYFNLGNSVLNFLIGPVLQARLDDMVKTTLRNLQRKIESGANF